MNNLDKKYTDLLQDILDNGVKKETRNGSTLSVFGRQIRHKMSEGFPLLTTKKMYFKGIVTELLWFLRGDTNIKYLVDNDCHIWDGDAYKNFDKITNDFQLKNPIDDFIIKTLRGEMVKIETEDGDDYRILTQEEFINKIKTDAEFAKKWGELGPIYGKQWRSWKKVNESWDERLDPPFKIDKIEFIDQIQNLINNLKTNPDSRRLMVTAWNPAELDLMTLPPCHYGFQVYTRELSLEERLIILKPKNLQQILVELPNKYENNTIDYLEYSKNRCDSKNIPTRAISLQWSQRSVDSFLGLPFNIASYGLLLEIIAKAVNMVPDELIGNLGDTHLYLNHIEQAKEQIGRELTHEERHEMLKEAMGPLRYQSAVDEQVPFSGGLSEYYDIYKIPYRTREPYQLPTLKHMKTDEFYKSLSEDFSLFTHLDNTDFVIEGYHSHPTIKAPLSN
jgi:thymidylate synthase